VQVLQLIQVVVLGPSLFFVGYQVLLQRKQVRDQVAIQGYKLYHLLVQQYMEILRRADYNPELNCIWDPVDVQRHSVLEDAQRCRTWGAWYAMTQEERRCYRFVRSALETFEQTHQLHEKGWIDDETWAKWQGWINIWRKARHFDFVFEDTKPRLIKTFAATFGTVGQPKKQTVREA
jgi:hypothetical protein